MITPAHILGQSEDLLVECQQGFKLLPDVCVAFKQMQEAAKKDDVDIQIVSSYRSFERQLQIWKNKWLGKTAILNINEQPIDITSISNQEKLFAILTWSALPGASRHHWGTDLDVYDKKTVELKQHNFQLVCSEYEGGGPCKKLNYWLKTYAQDFEFYRPYQNYKGGVAAEPWHLSYRPIAAKIENQLNIDMLEETLLHSGIDDPQSIIKNLKVIFKQYVLNQGKT
ncbi:M15 family metallopeptidase [Paraglaciecola sp.]|uniref:M15 family metallopeptidase n=1 Tax=Paraglaciecola sp. TaxID=1920173 RepID=UPI003EF97F25